MGKGNKPATVPLAPRTARTIDLAVGQRHEGPILRRRGGTLQDDPFDPVGVAQRAGDRHFAAKGRADDHGPLETGGIHEVGDEIGETVDVERVLRSLATPEARLVRDPGREPASEGLARRRQEVA